MKVGIVSDTHGRDALLQAAIDEFRRRGAEMVVHCGDLGPGCLEALGCCGLRACAVAGNVDRDLEDMAASARAFGVVFDPSKLVLPLGGGKFLAVTHGDDPALLAKLIGAGEYAYVCHGHTHVAADRRVGAVRIINPGAIFNCRGPSYPGAAVLDSTTDDLEFVKVSLPAKT